jgi:hypothetical protein
LEFLNLPKDDSVNFLPVSVGYFGQMFRYRYFFDRTEHVAKIKSH